MAARTGEVLASEEFWGDPPRSCGQMEEISVRSLKGGKQIDFDEVEAWLAGYVTDSMEADGQAPAAPTSRPTSVPATALPVPATAPPAFPVTEESSPAP